MATSITSDGQVLTSADTDAVYAGELQIRVYLPPVTGVDDAGSALTPVAAGTELAVRCSGDGEVLLHDLYGHLVARVLGYSKMKVIAVADKVIAWRVEWSGVEN